MSDRQENMPSPPTTMKIALAAVIAAIYLDSNTNRQGNLDKVNDALQKLR